MVKCKKCNGMGMVYASGRLTTCPGGCKHGWIRK